MIVTRDVCHDFSKSSKLEWLETNGTGAFAMGTIAGVNTRRYHGLLVAALKPRCVLLSRVEEETLGYQLGAAQYPGVVTPRGFELIEEFRTEPCSTWRFNLGGVTLEKQVYLIDGRQAVVIRYRSDAALTLRVRPFLAYRDYHSLGRARSDIFSDLPQIKFHHAGRFEASADWYYNNEYLIELDRGLDFREDLYTPGVIVLELAAGEWTPICASIDSATYAEPMPRDDPFVIRRADGVPTIIAGYPWFTDWGRDTMISIPGLLIAKVKLDRAREMIEGFIAQMSQGLIPNRFPDAGETPEYNTADATLWMFQAVRAWIAAGGDRTFLRDVFYPAAKQVIDWHQRGTHYGIGVDPTDHLLAVGPQLTWMDTKYTPRAGKPVEINALWHGALSLMAEWFGEFADEAERVRDAFQRKFWNAERECLYDLLTSEGPVKQLRPNQIFAASLPHGLLTREQQQKVVRVVEVELLTPVGLRTLERGDPEYQPRYEGSPERRDAAYHQGTVWPWLLGPFIDASMNAFGDAATGRCRQLIDALEREATAEGCVTSISEIYDGEIYDTERPRRPSGCPAQAWSVAEIARVKAIYPF